MSVEPAGRGGNPSATTGCPGNSPLQPGANRHAARRSRHFTASSRIGRRRQALLPPPYRCALTTASETANREFDRVPDIGGEGLIRDILSEAAESR